MRLTVLAAAAFCLALPALAGPDDFAAGPRVPSYGKTVPVPGAVLPADARFKVAFDLAAASEGEAVNRNLDSAARLFNMHALAGVPDENVSVAIVVHGPAAMDVINDAKRDSPNPNAGLVAELVAAGASIQLCGQTAASRNITQDDLLPGVTLSLSAMTAHALLQQDGYTLNPF
ncbi:DsrE family protein [Hyphomonas sp.]|uniref:DsrE family protein n=1 Tax=Hyphomonas sp. TaxID=87 RepID=UPI00391C98C7